MRSLWGTKGTASVEASGLALAVAVLVASLAAVLPQVAPKLAAAVEQPIRKAVEGTVQTTRQLGGMRDADPAPPAARGRANLVAGRAFSIGAGRRWGSGSVAADLDGCLACAGGHFRAGSGISHRNSHHDKVSGGGLGITGGLWAALARAQATASLAWSRPGASVSWDGRVRAMAGAGLEGQARIGRIDGAPGVAVGFDAAAGARVRAEYEAAASLAGIAVKHTAGVEGWAGLGATFAGHASFEAGRVKLGGRAGAALGVGAAFDTSVELDMRDAVSKPWLLRTMLANPAAPGLGAAAVLLAISHDEHKVRQ